MSVYGISSRGMKKIIAAALSSNISFQHTGCWSVLVRILPDKAVRRAILVLRVPLFDALPINEIATYNKSSAIRHLSRKGLDCISKGLFIQDINNPLKIPLPRRLPQPHLRVIQRRHLTFLLFHINSRSMLQ